MLLDETEIHCESLSLSERYLIEMVLSLKTIPFVFSLAHRVLTIDKLHKGGQCYIPICGNTFKLCTHLKAFFLVLV